ncbi:HAD family acid phosphatase, partial [Escherichia coli]|uniref:HAD family acid phosphatase n=1 Tax=Escherichia coli TaxID=562 RepID=UPI002119885D
YLCPTQVFAEPSNLGLLKKQLETYYNYGEYLKELEEVAIQATDYIKQEVTTNQRQPHPKHLAIVLDIDETCLSNYANMKQDD